METDAHPSAARERARRSLALETVIGREAELDIIASVLGDPSDGAAAVLLEGEPGIGKTTLWEVGVQRGRVGSG